MSGSPSARTRTGGRWPCSHPVAPRPPQIEPGRYVGGRLTHPNHSFSNGKSTPGGYPVIWRVWIWRDIHAHEYFCGRGTVELMDLDLDLVLQYPSKSAPLPSLVSYEN
jgi:hypothetical protein